MWKWGFFKWNQELGLSNSRCGKYCYQVFCVKGEVEEGKEEECGDQKQSVGTEASRGALTKELTTQI